MKKLKILAALLAIVAVIFAAGCSDSSDGTSSGSSSSLIGTWSYSETENSSWTESGGVTTVLETRTYTYYFYFASNGTVTVSESVIETTVATGESTTEDKGVVSSGTWSLSGSTLTLAMSESEEGYGSYSYELVYTVSFSGNTITLTPIAGTETTTIDGKTETISVPDAELGDPITLTRVS